MNIYLNVEVDVGWDNVNAYEVFGPKAGIDPGEGFDATFAENVPDGPIKSTAQIDKDMNLLEKQAGRPVGR